MFASDVQKGERMFDVPVARRSTPWSPRDLSGCCVMVSACRRPSPPSEGSN